MSEKINSVPAPEKKSGPDQWEVDSAVETLLRAEEIKKNAPLMKAVQKKLSGKAKAIRSVQDLRKLGNQMGEEEEAE